MGTVLFASREGLGTTVARDTEDTRLLPALEGRGTTQLIRS